MDKPGLVEDRFTRVERMALALAEIANEHPIAKRLQTVYLTDFNQRWIYLCLRNQLIVEGLDDLASLHPERGVLLCANHRSFFDLYVITTLFSPHAPWLRRMYFPVRANFFYESWAGIVINALIGGMAMYPAIWRDGARRELNKVAMQKVAEVLEQPGSVVGMHPEGTRGKGPDPYQLLPAQPGVGQVIMAARPVVIPVFVNGLGNDLGKAIWNNFKKPERRGPPIVVVFGKPIEFGSLLKGNPRASQYKRVADHVAGEIGKLSLRERELRQAAQRG